MVQHCYIGDTSLLQPHQCVDKTRPPPVAELPATFLGLRFGSALVFSAVGWLYFCFRIKGAIKHSPIAFGRHAGEENSAVSARQTRHLETPNARQGSQGIVCINKIHVHGLQKPLKLVSTDAFAAQAVQCDAAAGARPWNNGFCVQPLERDRFLYGA